MFISVIIPNYNGSEFIINCINSIYKQTYKNFEIVFVDNGSNDNSCNIISVNYPNIKLIVLSENYGFSKAVNEGIKVSNGEYIVLLNNDTEVDREWLSNLVNCINKDKIVFSCCSKMIRYLERNTLDDAGDEYNILGWAYKRGDGESIKESNKDKRVFSSCAGAAIYRREVFDKIGYFDEGFFAYMEDVDISYRANIYGYKNVYCADAIVYHIGSATSGSKYNSFKVKLAARNNIYVAYKNMPLVQLVINSPFLLLGWIIKYLFFYKKGFSKVYLEGTVEGIKNIKNIKKVKFKFKNLENYFLIQGQLIYSTFNYVLMKLRNFYDK